MSPAARKAATGAKAQRFQNDVRGAEAPLFHSNAGHGNARNGNAGSGKFFRGL
jgi:hypothetical protein